MKHYKIVNRTRFITFITICMVIVLFGITSIFNNVSANNTREYSYKEVSVKYGDTLWDIAKEYGDSNTDIRETVYHICNINNIKASDLKAGQTILVPCK